MKWIDRRRDLAFLCRAFGAVVSWRRSALFFSYLNTKTKCTAEASAHREEQRSTAVGHGRSKHKKTRGN